MSRKTLAEQQAEFREAWRLLWTTFARVYRLDRAVTWLLDEPWRFTVTYFTVGFGLVLFFVWAVTHP